MINRQYIRHYLLEAQLGSGRYADVYRAVDTVRKRTVALKVLKPNMLPGEQSLTRFLQQVQLASELVHPYLAWIWETGEENGVYYLAERFVDGPSLASLLSESGAMPWERLHPIIGQVAQGLDFAHAKGWVHGDVKPQNILISHDLGAVLIDFGITRALYASSSSSRDRHFIFATPYAAKEIQQGQIPGPAADQYSLACVVMEALTGHGLYDAPRAATGDINLQEKALLTSWLAKVPSQVGVALERALSEDPAARYSSLAEFIATLDELVTQGETTPESRTRWEAETRARLAAEEQSRQQAEEKIRLAALEQARREIREELEQIPKGKPVEEDLSDLSDVWKQSTITSSSRRKSRFHPGWGQWLIWIFIVSVITLAAFLYNILIYRSGSIRITVTPTTLPVISTFTPTESKFPTKTLKPSATPTTLPTSTSTTTSKPTWTHTPSFTPTHTQTSTHSLKRERIPRLEVDFYQ